MRKTNNPRKKQVKYWVCPHCKIPVTKTVCPKCGLQYIYSGHANPRTPSWDVWYGKRVKIKPIGGMKEFYSKTGTVVGIEGEYLRIVLDEPVMVKGVGWVEDDLWMPSYVTKIKERNPGARWHKDAAERATHQAFIQTTLGHPRKAALYEHEAQVQTSSEISSMAKGIPNPDNKAGGTKALLILGALFGVAYLIRKRQEG